MITFLIVLHVIICVLLVVTVLLQFGKGAEMGAVMGGGASQAVFSSSAKGNFMTKLTTILAIGFMVNSIVLTTMKSRDSKRSLFDNEAPVAAPLNSDVQALDTKGVETVPATDANGTPASTPAPAEQAAPAAPATQPANP
ncbi:preprotein translocase subunit SecG [Peredibacter starrii]|uniref:Protein-export membrane protein SecG n=1 Tax=Peredibacter starrii TaxID=28202 RepID=A0AAX4HNI6_9BACT|nr:preprotein translocase subunit SecG [Peredibacter starrii]WPU64888.1 preprotein translocase subunit SecG [Peredibacter starrii]